MSTNRFVHVCLTPALIDQYPVANSIVVAIDVLRATSSMCVGLDSGADHIIPVEKVDDVPPYREQGYLIAGERDGFALDGFDMGNSPFSFMEPRIKGAKIAMTTTNGTRAIKAAQERNAREVLAGSFANLSILAKWLIEQDTDVILLCAGWKNNLTLEDTAFAGGLANRLRSHFNAYPDTTLIAETLYLNANLRKRFFMRQSSHFQRLVAQNLQEEVKYCMRKDTHDVLPLMVGERLYDISKYKGDYRKYKEELRNRF